MFRLSSGYYRDVFNYVAYDVFRDRAGWRYKLANGKWSEGVFPTKVRAEQAARSAIDSGNMRKTGG